MKLPRALLAVAFAAFAVLAQAGAVRAASAPRIVSLVPSMTEDLFAIGAGPQVVGISEYTDFPAEATSRPVVASIVSLNAERIEELHPDLVVGLETQRPLVADLQRIGLHVELFPDHSFDDLFTTIASLGTLSGHVTEAAKLAKHLRAKTDALVATVPAGPRVRTLVVLGTSPIYAVGDGSYIAHLVELAGGTNAGGVTAPYARLGAEAILASDPDVVVADPRSGLKSVFDDEPWRSMRAVRENHAYVLDDPDILLRPGPRYVEGLQWLIEHLHPHAARS